MDIVGYINTQEPVLSWPPEKKLKLLERFCRARGYRDTVDGAPNPVTRKEFMNADIENYIKTMFVSDAREEAKAVMIIEDIDFGIMP